VADNYNPLNDPEFHALSMADKHAYLTANDPGYKALPTVDQGAYLSYLGQPSQEAQDIEAGKTTFPQTMWKTATAPIRYPIEKAAEFGGAIDVSRGAKTPKEAAANVKKYGEQGTQVVTTAGGGMVGKLLRGTELGAATGRVLTQAGQSALQNPDDPYTAALQGAAAAATGEVAVPGLIGAAKKVVDPFGVIKGAMIKRGVAKEAAERAANAASLEAAGPKQYWDKTYLYGNVPGTTEPKLLKDVITPRTNPEYTAELKRQQDAAVAKAFKARTTGSTMGGVRASADTFADWLRQRLQGNSEKPGRNPQ
jgi:hypothetical protein